ncbi:DUF4304 domain-containing protein [Rufibacter roseus]|uniref:DUF4304 domain-containing protein n=1 Tax=Rufibacter roseus TaxID=1567108 RepID=A0ABW2DEW4_9BACT|nr:DUF4304 domain-containing protein [Rufibacter roseus]
MKTIAETKFNRILKEGFQEVLKPLGFKKKGNNFYLQLEELGQAINAQKSRWNTKDDISFTINVGVFLPDYWQSMVYNQGKPLPTFPSVYDCYSHKRIGQLRNQLDTWYDVDASTDEEKLIVEMKDNLVNYVLPYLNRVKTKEDFFYLFKKERE